MKTTSNGRQSRLRYMGRRLVKYRSAYVMIAPFMLLFFVFTGIFCGTVFSERTSLVLSAFGMVLAVLLCGVYLPFSAFGPLATALSHLPYALGVALYAKATSHTVLFSIIYALSAAVFSFAAFRKRYLK